MADTQLGVLLQHQRQHLLDLKHRWANLLVSATRFDWHIQYAVHTAIEVTGQALPLTVVRMPVWTENDCIHDQDINLADTVVGDVDIDDGCTPSADNFLIADALEHEVGIPEEIESSAWGHDPVVSLVWETPVGLIQS